MPMNDERVDNALHPGTVGLRSPQAVTSPESDTIRSLQTLPYAEALELLDTIRRDDSLQDSSVPRKHPRNNTAVLVPFLSEQTLLRSLLPSRQNSLKFELSVRYPLAYPTLLPLNIRSLPEVGNFDQN